MGKPCISFVVAMDRKRLIGLKGKLPWRLPDDMKRFRQITLGKPVIMGRKTYESLPPQFRPLPGRQNIVVTRSPAYEAPGCAVAHSVEDALRAAGDADEVMVIGGAALYVALLPQADRLYLTLVEGEFAGDTFFPPFNPGDWQEVWREEREVDGRHAYRHTFLILDRKR